MNTFRDKSPGSRPAWHYLFVTVVIILWLAACGGGSGNNAAGPVVVVPPPQTCAIDPGVEHDCPLGAICVGYVTGTSVDNIYPVAFGNRPDWSPDGLQIAFHREGTVYIVNADGSGEYALAPGSDPAWSPHTSASMIAFTSPDGIAVVNRDGSNYRTVVSNDIENSLYYSSPSWAPSGEVIAFEQLKDIVPSESQIYTMDIDGSWFSPLIGDWNSTTAFEQDPSWSPSRWGVAFTTPNLAIVDGDWDVSVRERVSGPTSRPDWSPDGSLIAFSMFERCGRAAQIVAVIDPFESGVKPLLANALEPAWSPDGARIAFATSAELPSAGSFPPLMKPARVYVRESPSIYEAISRFVIYDDQQFELQYVTPRAGFFTYTGNYTQADARLTFNFHASNLAGPWTAYGEIVESQLTVKFNTVMGLADFEDGVYVLVPQEE